MCEYVKENKCGITQEICPYMYYCDKIQSYRASKYMPTECKIKQKIEAPKGYYKVRQERKGFLYIDYKEYTIKVKNPFDHIPPYVKVRQTKEGEYKLRE